MITDQATSQTTTSSSLTDTGLLILRIGVGAAMLYAGLRKAFDFNTTVGFMETGGWKLSSSPHSWSRPPRPRAESGCCSAC